MSQSLLYNIQRLKRRRIFFQHNKAPTCKSSTGTFHMTWMQTLKGTAFSLENPDSNHVDFIEVSYALSQLCRFAGHTREFYSVAEHSCRVADILPQPIRIYGLLHDAHEAYIGDWTTPVKRAMPPEALKYLEIVEAKIERAIRRAAGLSESPHTSILEAVKYADNLLCVTERRDLLAPTPQPWSPCYERIAPLEEKIEPWTPERARYEFTKRFALLTKPAGATEVRLRSSNAL